MRRAFLAPFETWLLLGILTLGGHASLVQADPPQDSEKLNKKIDSLTLHHPGGKAWSLDEVKSARAVVVVFLSFDCPVSNSYAPTLADLHREYTSKKVAFLGIDASDDLSPEQIARKATEFSLPFSVFKDQGHRAADTFHASTAPQAFVLDHNRVLRYRGRIDNSFSARLKRTARTTSHDLKDALDDLLAGKSVRTPATEAIGCPIVRDRVVKADGKVTYHRDVLPILQMHCQKCHRPSEVGPFSLMSFKQAVNWAQDIKDYTHSRKMPPWKASDGGPFHNERALTARELATLASWVEEGTPEGDPKQAPPAREFVEGWQLGKPDLILTVPEDFTIGPSGKDAFRCFVLPTGLTEDKFVIGMEIRPGNKRVVHHTLNFWDASGKARDLEQKEKARVKKTDEQDHGPGYSVAMGVGFTPDSKTFGTVGGWAPGQQARFLPEGFGYPLGKGADIVIQTHYHRNGRVEKDRLSIGLYFAKKPGIKPFRSAVIPGRFLIIPAGVEKYRVTGKIEALEDGTLHSVMHHMHMLGRTARVTMTPPGGKPSTLLRIDDWDYNWQETYFLRQPIAFKAGTTFEVEAVYDNSAKNPNNPFDPPRWVRFGEQTDNEMCFVFLGMTTNDPKPGRFRFKADGGSRLRIAPAERKPD